MSQLLSLQSQIETLQRQASEIRTKEFSKTVEEIRQLMTAYGISIKDLQSKTKSKGKLTKKNKTLSKAPAKAKKPVAAVAAKYRGPDGQTWSGRGLTPKWLSALIASGKLKESFLITTQAPSEASH